MKNSSFPDVYLPIYSFFQNLSRDLESLWRIFDLLPIGVMAVNNEGTITYYNKSHAKLDQLTQKEVLGRQEAEVFGFPDVSPGIMRTCQKMKRPILGFMCPYYTTKNPARLITGAYWVFPLFGYDRQVTGSVCFTMQLTDKQSAVDSKQLMWPEYMPLSKINQKIVGDDKVLVKARHLAKSRANSPSAVLISGETGTGKELFARLIHESSNRSSKPFIPINCAAIPGHLLEGLLFGTTKGSFTGSVDRAGLFEEANGGTIYLDEIDSMPMELQPKLLRILQEMKVSRLGSSKEMKLDVKLISSIGTPIHDVMVKEKMRADLFYRLAVIVINVPPLRERLNDLDVLLNYFIAKYNKQLGKMVVNFDSQAIKWLRNYSWPGNIRELENLVASSINMSEDETILSLDHLPDHYLYQTDQRFFGNQPSGDERLMYYGVASGDAREKEDAGQFPGFYAGPQNIVSPPANARPEEETNRNAYEQEELSILKEQLAVTNGKLTLAAKNLGISRQLLCYKMKKYNLSRFDFMSKLGKNSETQNKNEKR